MIVQENIKIDLNTLLDMESEDINILLEKYLANNFNCLTNWINQELSVTEILHLTSIVDKDIAAGILKLCNASIIERILPEINHELCEIFIEALDIDFVLKIIERLSVQDAVYVLECLDESSRSKLLDKLSTAQQKIFDESFEYPEDSAGKLMHQNFIAVPIYWTIGNVIDYLRDPQNEIKQEHFYDIIVYDSRKKPIGTIMPSYVLCHPRNRKLNDIINRNVQVFDTSKHIKDIVKIFNKYGITSTPIISNSGRLVGIIELDDILKIVQENNEEDLLHMNLLTSKNTTKSPLSTALSRFPWIFISFLTAMITAFIISFFKDTISNVVELAVLMPVIAAVASNVGMQSSTVTICMLSHGEINRKIARTILKKEFLIGLINGFLISTIFAIIAYVMYYEQISQIIIISGMFTLIIASVVGSFVPLTIHKIKFDPVISSSIFVMTVTDVVSYSSFLGVGTFIIYYLL